MSKRARASTSVPEDDPIEDADSSNDGLSDFAESKEVLDARQGLLDDAKIQLRTLRRAELHEQLCQAPDLQALDKMAQIPSQLSEWSNG